MPRVKRPSPPVLRSSCPIAAALDLLGDKWSLLVIRDLFSGKQRYSEFAQSPEGIPTNILADRLGRLERAGMITSSPYQTNPPRYSYSLTPRGSELKPVVAALGMWGQRHVPGTKASASLIAKLGK